MACGWRGRRSDCSRDPRLQGDTLQEEDWLAPDGEGIVIPATPGVALRQ